VAPACAAKRSMYGSAKRPAAVSGMPIGDTTECWQWRCGEPGVRLPRDPQKKSASANFQSTVASTT
jgi:hypothetical protein